MSTETERGRGQSGEAQPSQASAWRIRLMLLLCAPGLAALAFAAGWPLMGLWALLSAVVVALTYAIVAAEESRDTSTHKREAVHLARVAPDAAAVIPGAIILLLGMIGTVIGTAAWAITGVWAFVFIGFSVMSGGALFIAFMLLFEYAVVPHDIRQARRELAQEARSAPVQR